MNTQEQIEKDYLDAYKAHDEIKIGTLRLLKSALKNAEIALKNTLSDSDIVSIIKKEIKQRQESIEAYKKADRADSARAEEAELKILESYLPSQFNEEKITQIAKEIIDKLEAKDVSQIGQVIGKIMAQYKDSVDGALVSRVVQKLFKE